MDLDDLQSLTQSNIDKNNIYLDDIPVDSLLYNGEPVYNPSPADIALLWAEGYYLTETIKKTLVSILVNKISVAINLNRVKEAELVLKTEIEKAESNPAECAKLLITLVRLNEKVDPLEAKKDFIKLKKLISRNVDLLDEKTRKNWCLLSSNANFYANPYLLRSRALEMVEKQQYAEAEKIYREMIEQDIDLPGTLCHLARVQLLSGQEDEAEKSVRKAWILRSKAMKYVVPRIIFFKIIFLMMRNRDPSLWINKIEGELQNPDSLMEWYIKPLLEIIKPRVTPENYQILAAIAESLQYKKT